MKPFILLAVLLTEAVLGGTTLAQGVIVFDQQSSVDETAPAYGSYGPMQDAISPWGQSFTPALDGIDFVRFKFVDGNVNDGLGATVYVNLRSGSMSGPLLAVSDSVTMASLFSGVTQFNFAGRIPVTPESVYYLEPVLWSGGPWNMAGYSLNYLRGSAFNAGIPVLQSDFWFREGMLVPEPATTGLAAIGGMLLVLRAAKRRSHIITRRDSLQSKR